MVNAGHLSYAKSDMVAAAKWLVGNAQKLNAMGAGGEE